MVLQVLLLVFVSVLPIIFSSIFVFSQYQRYKQQGDFIFILSTIGGIGVTISSLLLIISTILFHTRLEYVVVDLIFSSLVILSTSIILIGSSSLLEKDLPIFDRNK